MTLLSVRYYVTNSPSKIVGGGGSVMNLSHFPLLLNSLGDGHILSL